MMNEHGKSDRSVIPAKSFEQGRATGGGGDGGKGSDQRERHRNSFSSRRSQNARVLWARMRRLIDRWLPPARICHLLSPAPHGRHYLR